MTNGGNGDGEKRRKKKKKEKKKSKEGLPNSAALKQAQIDGKKLAYGSLENGDSSIFSSKATCLVPRSFFTCEHLVCYSYSIDSRTVVATTAVRKRVKERPINDKGLSMEKGS